MGNFSEDGLLQLLYMLLLISRMSFFLAVYTLKIGGAVLVVRPKGTIPISDPKMVIFCLIFDQKMGNFSEGGL